MFKINIINIGNILWGSSYKYYSRIIVILLITTAICWLVVLIDKYFNRGRFNELLIHFI